MQSRGKDMEGLLSLSAPNGSCHRPLTIVIILEYNVGGREGGVRIGVVDERKCFMFRLRQKS